MNDLSGHTREQLTAMYDQAHAAADELFTRASAITRRMAALPSLSVPGVLEEWRELRAQWETAQAAGEEQLELMQAVRAEIRRRRDQLIGIEDDRG